MDIDALAADAEEVSTNELVAIAGLVKVQLDLEGKLAIVEAELKVAKAALLEISDVKLPDMLEAAGMAQTAMDDGTIVKLDKSLECSVPKKADRFKEITDWLNENDGGHLIGDTITIDLGKSAGNSRPALIAEIEKLGFTPIHERKVNTASLKTFISARLKEGKSLKPLTFYGAHSKRRVKITQ
jgi:hypothetical protein